MTLPVGGWSGGEQGKSLLWLNSNSIQNAGLRKMGGGAREAGYHCLEGLFARHFLYLAFTVIPPSTLRN